MADLPEGFDLEALLAPIPGDAPQGIDIREDFSAHRRTTGCAMRGPRRAMPSAAQDAGEQRHVIRAAVATVRELASRHWRRPPRTWKSPPG